jgi:hypothetical protein
VVSCITIEATRENGIEELLSNNTDQQGMYNVKPAYGTLVPEAYCDYDIE